MDHVTRNWELCVCDTPEYILPGDVPPDVKPDLATFGVKQEPDLAALKTLHEPDLATLETHHESDLTSMETDHEAHLANLEVEKHEPGVAISEPENAPSTCQLATAADMQAERPDHEPGMPYRLVEGRRANSRLYVADDKHLYLFKNRSAGIVYLRCRHYCRPPPAIAHCRGTARIRGDKLIPGHPHCHLPTSDTEAELSLLSKMRSLVDRVGEHKTPREIFKAVESDTAQAGVSYTCAMQMIRRRRDQARRQQPDTPAQAAAALAGAPEFVRRHHAFTVQIDDQVAVVFQCEAVSEAAGDCARLDLILEETWSRVPAPFSRLLMVLADSSSAGGGSGARPAFVALLTAGGGRPLYDALLERAAARLGRPADRLAVDPRSPELHAAAAAVWPGATLHGCWHHLARDLLLLVRDLESEFSESDCPSALGVWLRRALVLSLVPETHQPAAWQALDAAADDRKLPTVARACMTLLRDLLRIRWRSVPPHQLCALHEPLCYSDAAVRLLAELHAAALIQHPLFWIFVRHLNALLDAAGRTAADGTASASAAGSAGGAAPARSSESGAEQDAAVLRRLREMAAGLDQGVLRSVKQYGRAGNQCGLAVKRNQSGRAVKQYGRAANRSGHAVDRGEHAVDQGWQSLNPIGHVMPAYLDAAAKLMHSRIVALAKLLAEGQDAEDFLLEMLDVEEDRGWRRRRRLDRKSIRTSLAAKLGT